MLCVCKSADSGSVLKKKCIFGSGITFFCIFAFVCPCNWRISLFDQSEYYLRIVEALAGKRIGLTRDEILKLTKLPDNGMTSIALKDLVNCGFLRVYQYFGRKNKTEVCRLPCCAIVL